MPDHLHLLLTPEADISIERALQLIKGGFSYRLGKAKRGPVWQESFTNHRIREEHDYERHAGYIRMNPLRARLVERPEMYPYSSASARFGRRMFGRGTTNVESRAISGRHFLKRSPIILTLSGTTCKSVYLWKSGHSWPRCGNAKECRPLGPGACRAKAGRSIESFTRF